MKALVIIVAVIVSAFLVYLIYCLLITFMVNKKVFKVRGTDPDNPCYLQYEDYSSFLSREEYRVGFYGEAINGYIYKDRNRDDYKGFIILSHGFFGTHIQYLVDIAFLAKEGYKVLAFDQFGVGISEGDNQVSLANGVYVLENVIKDVEKRKINDKLPLYLYGHSWGAYCSLLALKKHPEIEKAVLRSGFINPTKTVLSLLKSQSKALYYSVRPLYSFSYYLLFGRRNMIDGKHVLDKNKKTKCLFVHAKDDDVINYEKNSQNYYFIKHKKANSFFYTTEDGGHNTLITTKATENYKNAVEEYSKLCQIKDEKEKTRKIEEFTSSLDRVSMYPYRSDVIKEIASFIED